MNNPNQALQLKDGRTLGFAEYGIRSGGKPVFFFHSTPGEVETQQSAEEWLKSGSREDLKDVKGVLPKFKKKYWPMLGDIAKELSMEFAVAGAMELITMLLVSM